LDSITLLQRAVDNAAEVIGNVQPADLSKPTPCREWDVRMLLNHIIGSTYLFAGVINERPIDTRGPVPDLVGDNPVASYAAGAKAMMAAWRTPGTLERRLKLPFAELPGAVAIQIITSDQIVHTWDLLQALGRGRSLDSELAGAALQIAERMYPVEGRRPGLPIEAAIPVVGDAPIQDRLAAHMGRQV
jgi:uncharacterized protein (TIGR03086 family)